jgi:hypothetical protein
MSHFVSRLLPRAGVTGCRWPAAALLLGSCLCWSAPAGADTALAVELSYDDAVDSGDDGIGLDVLFGPRFDLVLLTLGTEIGGGIHDFSGGVDPAVYRAVVGARLGLGAIVRPSVYTHFGVGHLRYETLGGRESRTGLAGDVGIALDFTVLPLLNLGVHYSYNGVFASDDEPAFDWTQLGAHAVLVF